MMGRIPDAIAFSLENSSASAESGSPVQLSQAGGCSAGPHAHAVTSGAPERSTLVLAFQAGTVLVRLAAQVTRLAVRRGQPSRRTGVRAGDDVRHEALEPIQAHLVRFTRLEVVGRADATHRSQQAENRQGLRGLFHRFTGGVRLEPLQRTGWRRRSITRRKRFTIPAGCTRVAPAPRRFASPAARAR
jgi:hypothetical protein